jgi:hypothetical protein
MSRWRITACSVPKAGEPDERNQDAFSYTANRHGTIRIALADGATNSHQPRSWAEALTSGWIDGRISYLQRNAGLSRALARLAHSWNDANVTPSDAPWYVHASAERGAWAALVAVEVQRSGSDWRWHGLAFGDSNLFQIGRSGRVIASFPVIDPSAYSQSPELLGTSYGQAADLFGRRLRRSGRFRAGERIFLASDALAACLARAEAEDRPLWIEVAEALRDKGAFRQWVADLRQAGLMADDDTTVVMVSRSGS